MEKHALEDGPVGSTANLEQDITTAKPKLFSKEYFYNYFPHYKVAAQQGIVNIEERPPVLQGILLSVQHVLAMFGSTVLAPTLIGMSTNTALFFSGIGTIIFFIITKGRVPSYLGSSFGFIGVVTSVTGYTYGPNAGYNQNLGVATGGIIVCGLVYMAISILVILFGTRWVEFLLPPVVTGSIVMTIGIHLSASAFASATATSFDGWMAFTTVMIIALTSVYAPSYFRRIPILIGMVVSYLIAFGCGMSGVATPIDYTEVYNAPWWAAPTFTKPIFQSQAISTIVPVCVVLTAENLGHIKAISAMSGTNLDKYIGRSLLGDAIATIVSGAAGGLGVTSYAENIGVLSVTNVYSTLIFIGAAIIAIFLGFIQKFGAAIHSIPSGVFGGLSIILFSMIAMTGARIWVENRVDFSQTRNLLVAGIPVIIGASMQTTLQWGNFQLDGIGLPTYICLLLNQILRGWDGFRDLYAKYQRRRQKQQEQDRHLAVEAHDQHLDQ
ncbi:permease family-domain-containing protein [Gongronella butleri]|nr:permease family-domain-containing protein [Gongronella butleri]